LIICFGEAIGQICYGAYGPLAQMSYLAIVLILGQLLASGVIVILIDSMLRQGYGLGSGINLFIVANTS
jgi:protein transport protein SEC61 subunit alpha